MQRATEAPVETQRRRGPPVSDALPVVELPTGGDHAAPHVLPRLPAHEAAVDACERNKCTLFKDSPESTLTSPHESLRLGKSTQLFILPLGHMTHDPFL